MVLSLIMSCQHLLNACPGGAVAVYLQCYSEILKQNSDTGYSETTEADTSTACRILTLPDDMKHSANFHHHLSENQSCHFLVNQETLRNLHIVLLLQSSTAGKT